MPAPLSVITKCAPDPSPEEIDRYGDLDHQVQMFAPVVEEHKLLKEKIEAAVATKPGVLPAQVEGHRYQLQLSARRNERTIIDKKKVFTLLKRRLGIDGFLALITIPLGEGVDRNTVESEQAQFLREERSGSRSIKVIPKRAAA